MSDTQVPSELRKAFIEDWGVKCSNYVKYCPACEGWKAYEYLEDSLEEIFSNIIQTHYIKKSEVVDVVMKIFYKNIESTINYETKKQIEQALNKVLGEE